MGGVYLGDLRHLKEAKFKSFSLTTCKIHAIDLVFTSVQGFLSTTLWCDRELSCPLRLGRQGKVLEVYEQREKYLCRLR